MVQRKEFTPPPQEYIPDIFPERFISGAQHEVDTRYQQAIEQLGLELEGRPPKKHSNPHPGNLKIDRAHRQKLANSLLMTGLLPHRGDIHSFHRLLTGSQATEKELTPDLHMLNLLAGVRVATFLGDYHQILNKCIYQYEGTRQIYDFTQRLRQKHRPYGLYSLSDPNESTGFGRNIFYSRWKWKDKVTHTGFVDVYPVLTDGMLRDDVDVIKHQLGVGHPPALSSYRNNARERTIRSFLNQYLGTKVNENPRGSIVLRMHPTSAQYDYTERWNRPHAELAQRDPHYLRMIQSSRRPLTPEELEWEKTTLDEQIFCLGLRFVEGMPYIGVPYGIGGGAFAVGYEIRGRYNHIDASDAEHEADPSSPFCNPPNAIQLKANASRVTDVKPTLGLFFIQSYEEITNDNNGK